ncbi:protein serine/threonine phosphatase 2C [Gonapodya prolifera JEL478]|uniref:Protein serine/threonine phosphatase 2C n=1 Tax=Gonapodya prolifera (strain JEL478) TaxID=1344416 RepID=A0A139AUF2_GONPJ|nr:protein serine/threonine phosphatase 2C [Gonapodya prolifera JEL478]|eukprot:KXS20203.1 protein serine/threonine phosphatase 2C [Gonapodya prolifera JEL478]
MRSTRSIQPPIPLRVLLAPALHSIPLHPYQSQPILHFPQTTRAATRASQTPRPKTSTFLGLAHGSCLERRYSSSKHNQSHASALVGPGVGNVWTEEQVAAFVTEKEALCGEVRLRSWAKSDPLSIPSASSLPHPLTFVSTNTLAANDPTEDNYSIVAYPATSSRDGGEGAPHGPPLVILTVADGHGGGEVARIVAAHLPRYVARHVRPLLDGMWHPEVDLLDVDDVGRALKSAARVLDADILSGRLEEVDRPEVARQGACAVWAVVRGDQVWVGNVGDCGAVVGVLKAAAESELDATQESGKQDTGKRNASDDVTAMKQARSKPTDVFDAIPLTSPHTLESPDELRRLVQNRPPSIWPLLTRGGRVAGVLVPTRAFGDAGLKWGVETGRMVGGVDGAWWQAAEGPEEERAVGPPYVGAEAEVVYYGPKVQVHENAADADGGESSGRENDVGEAVPHVLVLASDGVWDEMSGAESLRTVSSVVMESPAGTHVMRNPSSALVHRSLGATHLARVAVATHPYPRSVRDDATAIVAGMLVRRGSVAWGVGESDGEMKDGARAQRGLSTGDHSESVGANFGVGSMWGLCDVGSEESATGPERLAQWVAQKKRRMRSDPRRQWGDRG